MFCSGNPLGDPGGQDRLPAYHGPVLFLLLYSKIIFWKAWSFQDFLLERIFLSIAVSGLSGVAITLLYLYAPEGKSQKVFGIYEGLGTGGLLTASVCFSLFLKNSWRRAALLTAAAYGLAFILALFLGESKPERSKVSLTKTEKRALKLFPSFYLRSVPLSSVSLRSRASGRDPTIYHCIFKSAPVYCLRSVSRNYCPAICPDPDRRYDRTLV